MCNLCSSLSDFNDKSLKQLCDYDDVSLLKLYRDESQTLVVTQAACAALIARYASLVKSRANDYFVQGVDHDDLKQEAYMGLLNAIRGFNENNGASFKTFASHCIDNRLKNLLAASSTKKASVYKKSVSLDEMENTHFESDNPSLQNPESIFIQNENYANLTLLVEQHLSKFEKDVLFLYLSGHNYDAVASKLSTSPKSVDNALQRGRKKLKAVLNSL